MNAFCNFDRAEGRLRGDCEAQYECARECSTDLVGDGICQPSCFVPSCNWDARDCECANVIEVDAGYATEGTSIGSFYDNAQVSLEHLANT